MDLKLERASLIKDLEQVDDVSLLQAIKVMLQYGLKKEGRITLTQYNRELKEAEARIDAGNYHTQDEVEAMAKKW
ncbi:MAG: hypothetical protein KBF45_06005 [Cyclobacteriaceae bacterium]|jgi:hypothetical protein|nr:hypothetical protein [Cyclobacteriaceae bacterium]